MTSTRHLELWREHARKTYNDSRELRYRQLAALFPNVTDTEEAELDKLRDQLGYPDPFVNYP